MLLASCFCSSTDLQISIECPYCRHLASDFFLHWVPLWLAGATRQIFYYTSIVFHLLVLNLPCLFNHPLLWDMPATFLSLYLGILNNFLSFQCSALYNVSSFVTAVFTSFSSWLKNMLRDSPSVSHWCPTHINHSSGTEVGLRYRLHVLTCS